jgi:hypothetical protein
MPTGLARPDVQGLLVCRGVEPAAGGGVVLKDVLEIVQVKELPTDAGPISFVAFVRGLAEGVHEVAFRVHRAGEPDAGGANVQMRVTVPPGVGERQVPMYVTLPKVPVTDGGWYEVSLRIGEAVVARNRFAIGVRAGG